MTVFFLYVIIMKIKKKKYGCNAIFLFTDTSSLTYETETNDV